MKLLARLRRLFVVPGCGPLAIPAGVPTGVTAAGVPTCVGGCNACAETGATPQHPWYWWRDGTLHPAPEMHGAGEQQRFQDAAPAADGPEPECRWEYGVEGRWPNGWINLDWRDSRQDAEAVLAARAEIEGNVVVSRLVRRLIVTGPLEEVPEDD